ncbi:MFS transporter [Pseudomonas sp. CCC3.1]|uniref:MFS transporter n=1 Tax=Pseudomonas sp. CCC3.1 TaxID=3048607 RepID=UPI002AC9A1D8|nr:MFS transporter [Pseudomonas sp. CCC3.1]MEB0208063.1 MFS transporter [Pseudomonas sp. CCC3.1]WPX34601.1 MFS transporter [Pseudomonas sp. CCC3.1]
MSFHSTPSRSAGWTLLAVCTAALILPLSFSGGALATPAIGLDLGSGPLGMTWITNAFMLSFGSLLMAAGTLADRYGRKRMFIFGVAGFVLASLALGLAPTIVWFDGLRAVQGVAAAAALAGGSAALANTFEGRSRTRAFSLLGTSFGVGLALGPILAGVLIEHIGWRAVFVSGALIGGLALLMAIAMMQESKDPQASELDWKGTLSFTAALVLFTWGILLVPGSGWSSTPVLGMLFGAWVCVAVFVRIERQASRPMLELSLFRYPRFVGVQLLPIATCFCFVVLLVLLPVRLISIEGRSATETGLLMIALSAPMLIVPYLAGVLTHWASARVLSAAGLMIAAAGLLLLSQVGINRPSIELIVPLLVIGTGTGLPWGLMDGLSVSVVPKERAGMATGIFGTTRVAGEGISLAIVSALLAVLIQSHLPRSSAGAAQYLAAGDMSQAAGLAQGLNQDVLSAAYLHAFQALFYGLAALTVAVALLILWFLREHPVVAAAGCEGVRSTPFP